MVSYRAEPAANLRLEPLAGLTLVYHRRSGATHLIAEPMPQILAALANGPVAPHALVQHLADQFELGDDATEAIAARIDELVALGLVHRIDADA